MYSRLDFEKPLPNSPVSRVASSRTSSLPYSSEVGALLFLLEDTSANLVIRIDLKQVNAASSALTSRQHQTADGFVKRSGIPACAHCNLRIPCNEDL